MVVHFGEYQDGAFVIPDDSLKLERTGQCLVYDGKSPHPSEACVGVKFSVVASMHRSTMAMPSQRLRYLESLGFGLPDIKPDAELGCSVVQALPAADASKHANDRDSVPEPEKEQDG